MCYVLMTTLRTVISKNNKKNKNIALKIIKTCMYDFSIPIINHFKIMMCKEEQIVRYY